MKNMYIVRVFISVEMTVTHGMDTAYMYQLAQLTNVKSKTFTCNVSSTKSYPSEFDSPSISLPLGIICAFRKL